MKKIILLSVFLFGVIASAQTTFPTSIDKTFNWEEKDQNKTFNVTFLNGLKEIIIPQERLNNLIMNAVIKSKYKLKNKLSFRPIEVMVYKSGEVELLIFVKYGGKNAYGVESLSSSYYSFINEGEGTIEDKFTK
jgi:hypothetical protein